MRSTPCVRWSALVSLGVFTLFLGCAAVGTEPVPGQPAHHVHGGFRNIEPGFQRAGGWIRFKFFVRRGWQSLVSPRTFDAPRESAEGLAAGRALRESGGPTVTWVGHATLLVRLDGLTILTDPNWGDRASPFAFAGPRRLSPPGLPFEELPKVDVVVISHDHYDHLDIRTVKRLAAEHDPLFVVPLGLKAWFADNGMTRVEERDWWGHVEHRGVTFVCTPGQHFAQRTPWDANTRLWATWAVLGRRRLYFSGDTGYFSLFREIGARLGPFDLAAVAIGSYQPVQMMKPVHVNPEEALQVAEDLGARVALGIHWGTFDLADEPLDEPPRRMRADAERRGLWPERAWILRIGETRAW